LIFAWRAFTAELLRTIGIMLRITAIPARIKSSKKLEISRNKRAMNIKPMFTRYNVNTTPR